VGAPGCLHGGGVGWFGQWAILKAAREYFDGLDQRVNLVLEPADALLKRVPWPRRSLVLLVSHESSFSQTGSVSRAIGPRPGGRRPLRRHGGSEPPGRTS
jgi:hypothetical protein